MRTTTLAAVLLLSACGYQTQEACEAHSNAPNHECFYNLSGYWRPGHGIPVDSPAGQMLLMGVMSGAFAPAQPATPVHVIVEPDSAADIPLGPWSR